jgi:hypothetical protein
LSSCDKYYADKTNLRWNRSHSQSSLRQTNNNNYTSRLEASLNQTDGKISSINRPSLCEPYQQAAKVPLTT